MAVTTVAELINRTRRLVGDWPDIDVLTASVASNTTTLSVADGTLYYKNFHLEIDNELLTVAANGSGTTFTARRGSKGSAAATHVSGSEVKINPAWPDIQILDALNQAKDESFPLIYKDILDTSLTALSNTYEYTIPSLDGVTLRYISKVELKISGQPNYFEVRGYQIRRGATPKIQFASLPATGATIRIHGFNPFPDFTLGVSSTDTQWPVNAVNALPTGAAAFLLMSGEAGRVRADTLPNDQREQANRPGASMSVSAALYSRFRSMVLGAAMPPLPKHVKPTF